MSEIESSTLRIWHRYRANDAIDFGSGVWTGTEADTSAVPADD